MSAPSGIGFPGVGYNGYYPPDPNLTVGDTQIVQATNVQFAVFDKSGTLLNGPVAIDTLFSSLGGQCASINGGDPIVLWDKIAHRWLISQMAHNSSLTTNSLCIAVSTSADARGSFNLYAFPFSHLPDYPKFGIWASSASSGNSDYYFSANLFSKTQYFGPVVCAFNGSDMQNGAAARYSCSQGSISNFSLLPSDFDGATPPATGEPNYFLELGTGGSATSGTTLLMFPFRATWTPTGGSLNNPSTVTVNVSPYTTACSGGGTCIPQPGTTQQVDSLGDRLMNRLSYRNFGSYESLLVNHSVNAAGGIVGIRWYEIRSNSGGTLASAANVYQQGTYSLDSSYRWMGSIAQDRLGNIGLGYSISNGTSLYPSINYTGRVPSDSLGTMEAENTIIYGTGSETGASRWGDYTSLSLDPSDDCTFWYTNEYFLSSSGVGWSTQIASFKFPTCGSTKTATTTTLSSSLSSATYGQSITFTATVTPSAATGTAQFLDGASSIGTVALSGGTAQLMTSALAVGSHSFTATYSGDSSFAGSTSTAVGVTVTSASRTNVALAANGATATASSTYSSAFPPAGTIDGDRLGLNWGAGGGWNDGTANAWPDWLEVDFSGAQTISEVDVFTVQDNYAAPSVPTPTMTFTQYGLTDFQVQYWTGSDWVTVPNGMISGNNLVWRQITFPALTTTKIRIYVTGALSSFSRITEVEAYTPSGGDLPPTVSLTSPTNGAMYPAAANISVTATASDPDGAVSRVDFYANGSPIGTAFTAPYTITWPNVAAGSYSLTAVATDNVGLTTTSTAVGVTVTSASRTNVALAANGATATASSTYSSAFPPAGAIDGDRLGLNWGAGGGWNDGTTNVWPDWLEVDFSGAQTISEVDVFTVQDNYTAPSPPTPTMTFTLYGLTDFQVQYWTGSAWATVPNGTISGNNLVWRQVTFPALTTTRIRIFVTGALGTYSRITEVEAYTP